MLKQAVFAATRVARQVKNQKKLGSGGLTRELVQAVMEQNPEFQRLDGIMSSLAEACLNPTTKDTAKVIGVCSATQGEGKTTVALGLATALGRRAGSDVLLIEGDLANPSLAEDLQRDPSPGLVECLQLEEALESAIQPTLMEHLWVITAGQASDDPISLLAKANVGQLFRALRSRYQNIVLDMPAILEREEAGRLVELVDGVILVIAAGKVSKAVTESGVAAIGRDKLMGVVLNRARLTAPRWMSRILSVDDESSVL
jgi:capsular exopolysaccharide synthesis family protein